MSASAVYCSFCRKSQHEVTAIVAGPNVFICEGCVDLCRDIFWRLRGKIYTHAKANPAFTARADRARDLKPRKSLVGKRVLT